MKSKIDQNFLKIAEEKLSEAITSDLDIISFEAPFNSLALLVQEKEPSEKFLFFVEIKGQSKKGFVVSKQNLE